MSSYSIFLLVAIGLLACESAHEQHIFYLHGRIVELQGPQAISEQFGPYEYEAILAALAKEGRTVYSEVRPADVDFAAYCTKVSRQVDALVGSGIAADQITIIGASKGAVMAMQISYQNTNPINYILLAANNDELERQQQWNLHGRILGIYEASDALAGKHYQHWIERSANAQEFQQLKLDTGLGHGFLYRPLAAWLAPTQEWIRR